MSRKNRESSLPVWGAVLALLLVFLTAASILFRPPVVLEGLERMREFLMEHAPACTTCSPPHPRGEQLCFS